MEKRISQRHPETAVIQFTVHRLGNTIFDGITRNVSEAGLSFCSLCDLREGDVISICDVLLSQFGRGIVRWSRRMEDLVSVGIECTG